MKKTELFESVGVEELKRGYSTENEIYTCLLCGASYVKGIIYSEQGVLYEAE